MEKIKGMTSEELLFTLDLAKRHFPSDAHPEHFRRFEMIERIVKNTIKTSEKLQQK